MRTPEEKYVNDLQYHLFVDTLVHLIIDAQFTPSEVREAAMYACIRYDRMTIKPKVIKKDTVA